MTTAWDALPDTITTFMTALDARQVDRALATLTTDAVVTDEGHDHAGHDMIGTWIATAASEYTYTTEFTGATTTEAGVEVGQHLEGDFPGGVADLTYRFTLDGTLISRVVIEP
ncbi:nuclear transport factor 2 family protein [Mycobacterium sp. PSTR-4-N]|uniref:nuclear transport factor 2 family protein n=1 Tax=Mycobacterium sp. PSTR-4-N TaxID=2917745 RepID=UPI001F149DA7|nr:nuclear transport factor 2 family protein [Mycobacterium sp. PSTR-4-N]MCG7594282.1 nuclear transport factor 2 family protein [Mycobacterium sp. PSTR-4-N]